MIVGPTIIEASFSRYKVTVYIVLSIHCQL